MVFRALDACNTKVSNFQIALLGDDKVFRLDVPMDDLVFVDILKRGDEARNEELCRFLVELAMFREVVAEVAPL